MNPFLHYRWLLDSYAAAMEAGWSDADFVSLVERLDAAVAEVDGRGFRMTPLTRAPDLGRAVGHPHLWVKNETGNVGGSHKARHLFGVLLHLAIEERTEGELAIASCGNAALAAAVVARAEERAIRVFIPTWADEVVVGRLTALGAEIEVCERRPDEVGDPAFLRFEEALAAGSVPFSCQGPSTPTTLDGGRTIGWEIAEQLAAVGVEGRLRLVVQVGGGALATTTWRGVIDGIANQWLMASPTLHAVQTEACAPLERAWRNAGKRIGDDLGAVLPRTGPDRARTISGLEDLEYELEDDLMWPWEHVGTSSASGILDDVTYDWTSIVKGMLDSGGWPTVVTEEMVLEANRLARRHTPIPVDHTGSAGLAGLLDPDTAVAIPTDDPVLVLFTGLDRRQNPTLEA